MRKSRFTESQIVAILKEGEAGVALSELTRKHGWRSARAKTVEVNASHVAYMSHPKETAKLIEEAAASSISSK